MIKKIKPIHFGMYDTLGLSIVREYLRCLVGKYYSSNPYQDSISPVSLLYNS